MIGFICFQQKEKNKVVYIKMNFLFVQMRDIYMLQTTAEQQNKITETSFRNYEKLEIAQRSSKIPPAFPGQVGL